MKKNKHHIDQIFREKLQGYSEDPGDDLWSGISSGLRTDEGVSPGLWYKNILPGVVLFLAGAGILIYWISWGELYSEQPLNLGDNSISTVSLIRGALDQPNMADSVSTEKKTEVGVYESGIDSSRNTEALRSDTFAAQTVFSQSQPTMGQNLINHMMSKESLKVPDKLKVKGLGLLGQASQEGLLKMNKGLKRPLNIKIASPDKSVKAMRWKWFLTGGTMLSLGPDKAGGADGAGLNLLFGGGLHLSKHSMLSLTQTENFGSLGYTYLIGEKKLKFGIEGTVSKLGVSSYSLGFAVGLGAYYELAPKHRVFLRFARYLEYSEIKPIQLTAVSMGLQFNLLKRKNSDVYPQPGEYYVQKSPEKQNLNSGRKWFVTGSLDLRIDETEGSQVFSAGVGKYLNRKSFLQLSGKFTLDGANNDRVGSRFTLGASYNHLFGSKTWLLLTRAGVLMDVNGGDFLSEVGMYTNFGLGTLFRLNSKLDLYILPNLNRPFFTTDYLSRFAVQAGLNLRL